MYDNRPSLTILPLSSQIDSVHNSMDSQKSGEIKSIFNVLDPAHVLAGTRTPDALPWFNTVPIILYFVN